MQRGLGPVMSLDEQLEQIVDQLKHELIATGSITNATIDLIVTEIIDKGAFRKSCNEVWNNL